MKKSPLLEESLKAVIEETDEDLEDYSIFENTAKKHQMSINETIPNSSEKSLKTCSHSDSFKSKDSGKTSSFFKFQANQNQTSTKVQNFYLPKMTNDSKKYTLVLDLDETLVHFCEVPNSPPDNDPDALDSIPEIETPHGRSSMPKKKKKKHMFLVRPYVQTFLTAVSRFYEIVIFTASIKSYADYILDILDPENTIISHRLYRQHCDVKGNGFIKDLTKLGRSLSKTLIVDNSADNFRLQPDNGILIKSWYGEEGDEALKTLGPLLERVIKDGFEDVREALKVFKEGLDEENDRNDE
jgi:Dullard-like phosphatase family protein